MVSKLQKKQNIFKDFSAAYSLSKDELSKTKFLPTKIVKKQDNAFINYISALESTSEQDFNRQVSNGVDEKISKSSNKQKKKLKFLIEFAKDYSLTYEQLLNASVLPVKMCDKSDTKSCKTYNFALEQMSESDFSPSSSSIDPTNSPTNNLTPNPVPLSGKKIFEYFQLIGSAYNKDGGVSIPDGWTEIDREKPSTENDSLKAAVFKNATNKKLVIAIGGWNKHWGDYINGVYIAFGSVPSQWKYLQKFIDKKILPELQKGSFQGYEIIFSGHSLGAVLSVLANAYLKEKGYEVSSVNMESPGEKGILEEAIAKQNLNINITTLNVDNYDAERNIISKYTSKIGNNFHCVNSNSSSTSLSYTNEDLFLNIRKHFFFGANKTFANHTGNLKCYNNDQIVTGTDFSYPIIMNYAVPAAVIIVVDLSLVAKGLYRGQSWSGKIGYPALYSTIFNTIAFLITEAIQDYQYGVSTIRMFYNQYLYPYGSSIGNVIKNNVNNLLSYSTELYNNGTIGENVKAVKDKVVPFFEKGLDGVVTAWDAVSGNYTQEFILGNKFGVETLKLKILDGYTLQRLYGDPNNRVAPFPLNQVAGRDDKVKNLKYINRILQKPLEATQILIAGKKIYDVYSNDTASGNGTLLKKTYEIWSNNSISSMIILNSVVAPLLKNGLKAGSWQAVVLGSYAINILSDIPVVKNNKDLKELVKYGYEFLNDNPTCFAIEAIVGIILGGMKLFETVNPSIFSIISAELLINGYCNETWVTDHSIVPVISKDTVKSYISNDTVSSVVDSDIFGKVSSLYDGLLNDRYLEMLSAVYMLCQKKGSKFAAIAIPYFVYQNGQNVLEQIGVDPDTRKAIGNCDKYVRNTIWDTTNSLYEYSTKFVANYSNKNTINVIQSKWGLLWSGIQSYSATAYDYGMDIVEEYPISYMSTAVGGVIGMVAMSICSWGVGLTAIVFSTVILKIGLMTVVSIGLITTTWNYVTATAYNYVIKGQVEDAIATTCEDKDVKDLLNAANINMTELNNQLSVSQGNWDYIPWGGKDATVRESYNDNADKLAGHAIAAEDYYTILEEKSKITSKARTCLKATHNKYTSDLGMLGIYILRGKFLSGKKLFPSYEELKKSENKTSKAWFYSSIVTNGADLGVAGNKYGKPREKWKYLVKNGVPEAIRMKDIVNIKDVLEKFTQQDLRLADMLVNNKDTFKKFFTEGSYKMGFWCGIGSLMSMCEGEKFFNAEEGQELVSSLDEIVDDKLVNSIKSSQLDYKKTYYSKDDMVDTITNGDNCECEVVNICDDKYIEYRTEYGDVNQKQYIRGRLEYPVTCYESHDTQFKMAKTSCNFDNNGDNVIFRNLKSSDMGLTIGDVIIDCNDYLIN